MIKDYPLRLFIVFLSVFLFSYYSLSFFSNSSVFLLLLSGAYYLLSSLLITGGAFRIIHLLRNQFHLPGNLYSSIFFITFITLSFLLGAVGTSYILWHLLVRQPLHWPTTFALLRTWAVIGVVFILFYEILILHKEKEIDRKVLDQLDKERSLAEASLLKNSLEPHFLFNSLNALSYLIKSDPERAHTYNNKLIQIFKYFLVNNEKNFVSLDEELTFIENYYCLLQIRFDNMIHMNVSINKEQVKDVFIVPGALQTLVENAIKHNEFSAVGPLHISITLSNYFIQVTNTFRPKPFIEPSTKTGLRNLKERYHIIYKKQLLIKKSADRFIVKLPIIKNP